MSTVPHELEADQRLTAATVEAWFAPGREGAPSYADHLGEALSESEIAEVAARYRRQLADRVVRWTSVLAVLRGRRSGR